MGGVVWPASSAADRGVSFALWQLQSMRTQSPLIGSMRIATRRFGTYTGYIDCFARSVRLHYAPWIATAATAAAAYYHAPSAVMFYQQIWWPHSCQCMPVLHKRRLGLSTAFLLWQLAHVQLRSTPR